jgi:hypothetical protein
LDIARQSIVDGTPSVDILSVASGGDSYAVSLVLRTLNRSMLITQAIKTNDFRFLAIREWIASVAKPVGAKENKGPKKK